MKQSIIVKNSGKPGMSLAVFAGVHGNELAGVKALNNLITKVTITAGKVYFVYANPRAIKKGIRYIDSDLNRSFYGKVKSNSYETKRAERLKKILDTCDALLDLHAFNSVGNPFIICEKDSYELASKMSIQLVTSGWDKFDIGSTDGYMRLQGKQAICVELGSTYQVEKYIPLAKKSVFQFLKYYGAIENKKILYSKQKKVFIKIRKRVIKAPGFVFTGNFSTGQCLSKGKNFARDNTKNFISRKEYIFFPNKTGKIGDEACLLGNLFKNKLK